MAEEQNPPTQADMETMKKELADIKNEMMKKSWKRSSVSE